MTRERLLVLGLDEIHGIRWQCDACKAAMSFKVSDTVQVPQRCPACSAILVDGNNYAEYQSVVKLAEAVRVLRDATKQKTARATVKLEIIDGA